MTDVTRRPQPRKDAMSTAMKFTDVVDSVERLSTDEQEALVEIIRRRLAERRRERLVAEIAEARAEYARGEAQATSADDLMTEILE